MIGNDVLLSYDAGNLEAPGQAVLRFVDVLTYRVGDPNDEGFYGAENPEIANDSMYSWQRFPDLEFREFYEVVGFDGSSGLIGSNTQVLGTRNDLHENYRQYVFFMKDGSFECVCKRWEIA